MKSFRLRRNASLVYNSISPLLTLDLAKSKNLNSAFHGFSGTVLTQPEIAKLIDAMRCDEVETFETFCYEHIQNFRVNVVLTHLPCVEYMASTFWKALYGVNLLHLACILSAHSIIGSILKHDVKRVLTNVRELLPDFRRNFTKNTSSKFNIYEEVSAVHICGALGDYAGLRKLLKANFNPASQDILGRTPLHYATQTNLPMVVMLLSKDPTPIHIQDKFGKLPVDYCLSYQPQNIRDFLNEQSKAPSSAFVTDNDEVEMDVISTEQEETDSNLSMALNFEAYLCTQINPLYCYKGHTYCECCDDAFNHEVFSGHAVLDKLVASRKDRFIKRPTNTFGQFETPCSSVMAEFVRMTDDTPMEDLEKLFFRIWKLRKPGLVLSLHGSVPMGKASQKRYGQYGSVSEVMSLGMCGYVEAYRLKSLQVIGIVPWRRLPFQSHLRSSNYMVGPEALRAHGSTQVEFPQKGSKTELHTPLAPYHTRYLFVDSGPKNDIHCIQEFRTRFEAWLSKMTFRPESCNLTYNTPVCGILVAGRPEDALGVCEALKCNIPFVVVADSGGLASIIDQCLSETKYIREISQHYTEEAFGIFGADHERLLEIMLQYWPETHLSEELTALVTSILGYSHLMQFFFAESNSDASLDGKIVSALINPALFQDVSRKQSWKPRLKLAMELNKTDFVLEEILADSQWTLEEISPFARSCLLTNKPQFLRLFCDAGLYIHEFADRKAVEELFTIEAHRNTVGGRALKQFFLYYKRKVPANITVDIVEQTLTIMMGRKYFTHVTRGGRRCRCVIRKSKEASSKKQVEVIEQTSYLHENESYVQYLYLWALASKRYEIARYLLMMLTDITAAALFGASFLRRKARISRSPTDNEESKNYALAFENIALSILNQCYSSNVESTMQLLIMERQTFEQLSCFVIAAEGNCKHFMEHQACQEYLDRVWAHTLLVRAGSIKFFFILFVGIACPPAIPFIADYDETKYAQKSSDSVDDVAYSVLFCLFAIKLQFEFTLSNYGWMAVETAIILMATAHFIEYVKNTLTNWISWRNFIRQRINQFSSAAFAFYVVGVTLQVIFILPTQRSFVFEQFSRICLAFGAGIPVQQLLLLLSIHRYIGPKLQMIRKMVVRDLLPFLVIVLIFWSMYTIIFSVVILRPSGSYDTYGAISRLLRIMRSGFFQMFGEFNLEELLHYYGNSTCGNVTTSGCAYPYFKFLLPILLSLFTLTTHVLLINLLIAIFTKTYDDMEAESQQLWTMQRYALIGSILSQSVMPATLSIFPLLYQCFRRFNQSHDHKDSFKQKPFRGQNCGEETEKEKNVQRASRGAVRSNQEDHWHLLNRLRPADIKTGLKKPLLEQKIENIDKTLESIMTLDPFPDYSPIRWRPNGYLIPAWQMTVGETSPSTLEKRHASCRILSVDSSVMTTTSSSPVRSEEALRNPEGRVGIAGRGLLPQFGGNSACIVVVERSGFSDVEEVLLLKGVRAQAQFPWFLCYHEKDCDQISCHKELVRGFCGQMIVVGEKSVMIDSAVLQRLIATYSKNVYVGPVSDPINCDNAWLEVTIAHFKIISPFPSICNVERIFKTKGGTTMWARLDDLPPMRKSHLEGLKAIYAN
ncbi:Transient receptor potential cation channel subfamily M member [Echinococcus granulosus]|uniref:Transient receptor potential cation channel subfamily M member n=1 Tax=Echinococcus granulosus TaxID=6210 RepID=W6UNP3_ECHGR|nr:Transient receptor potential cation channel subfamily M member [Echinococcus granulosus]EUB63280.1 Transient receptor potential cation channel subfamily M member [Echinococcus granulosus]